MTDDLDIRDSAPDDLAAIEQLYPDAFPDEDLLPLVKDLLQEARVIRSLVAFVGTSLVGHVIFTRCVIAESGDDAALLGPLAVASAHQRQGIGSALIRAGLNEQQTAGAARVYVLGDPAYYGRLGFLPEHDVTPPYPLPAEWDGAWQSISLKEAEPPPQGKLSLPKPWLQPALWAP